MAIATSLVSCTPVVLPAGLVAQLPSCLAATLCPYALLHALQQTARLVMACTSVHNDDAPDNSQLCWATTLCCLHPTAAIA